MFYKNKRNVTVTVIIGSIKRGEASKRALLLVRNLKLHQG